MDQPCTDAPVGEEPCGPHLDALLWQPIFDRQGRLHGYESLIRLHGQPDTGTAIAASTTAQLWEITREMLAKMCDACSTGAAAQASHHFVNLEKCTLADPRCVDLLRESQQRLARLGCTLVVEITERPLRDPAQHARYLEHLRRLRRHRIPLALDDCPFPLQQEAVELAERLCSYVKIDLRQIGVPLQPCPHASGLQSTLDQPLRQFVERHGVTLIAEVIDSQWQHDFALSLPFSYFQGYHLQRPQRV